MEEKKNWFLNIRRCVVGLSFLACIISLFGLFPQRTTTVERVFRAQSQTRFQFMQQVYSERAYVDAAQSGVTITAQEVVSAGRLHVLVVEGDLDVGQDAALAVVDTVPAYYYVFNPTSRADYPVDSKYGESCSNAAEGYYLYSDAQVENLTAAEGQSQAGKVFWPAHSVVFTCVAEAVLLVLLFLLSRRSNPTALTQTLDSIYCALPDPIRQLGREQYQRLYRKNTLQSFAALVFTLVLALTIFSGIGFLIGAMALVCAMLWLGVVTSSFLSPWIYVSGKMRKELNDVQQEIPVGIAALTVRSLPEYGWHLATTRYVERRFTPFWQMVSLSTLLRLDGQTELALEVLDLAERQFARKKPAERVQACNLRCLLLWELRKPDAALTEALAQLDAALAAIPEGDRLYAPLHADRNAVAALLNADWVRLAEVVKQYGHGKSTIKQAQAAIWRYYAAAGQGDSGTAQKAAEELWYLAPGYAARFMSGEK